MPLDLDTTLAEAGDRIDELCFPEAGVIGFADVLESGQRLAVALTGLEGSIGWPLLLGNDRWLEEMAGEIHGFAESQYRRLLPTAAF